MMLCRVRPLSNALALGALLALASACGGEDLAARRALTFSDGGFVGPSTGMPTTTPAPEQPAPRDPAVTSLSPPSVGRAESRGHQAESSHASTDDVSGSAAPDDLACGYVCRGFAECFLEAEGSGICALCGSTARVRPECRPRFERGEACLKNFGPPRCQDPLDFAVQFLSICGFPVGLDEDVCIFPAGR